MAAQLLGAHMPASGGLPKAIHAAKTMGCTAIQIFTSSPQQWRAKEVTEEMASEFKKAVAETGINHITSHDSYLINLCAVDPDKREQSINGMKGEIERCAKYGVPYVVSHMGGHNGNGVIWGLDNVAESFARVLAETPDTVTVLMETTAGQGSSLMSHFEELAIIIEKLDGHERVGVCMDTCHIFAAGYDIRTRETYEETMKKFDEVIGFSRLKVVHCNDSKKGLGTRVDRHDHIGEGEIGIDAFRFLVNDPRFEQIPILLETDADDNGHERDLATLKSLIEA